MGRRVLSSLTLAAAIAMLSVEPVLADTAVREDVDLGTICQGMPWGDGDAWYVVRTASEPQYPDGATLRLSVVGIAQPPIATLDIQVDDDTVVLPADWTSQPGDGSVTSFPDWWTYTYVLTGITEGGVGGFAITWGVSVDGGPVVEYPVTWAVSVGSQCPDARPSPAPAATLPATDTSMAGVEDAHEFSPAVFPVVAVSLAALLFWRPVRRHLGLRRSMRRPSRP